MFSQKSKSPIFAKIPNQILYIQADKQKYGGIKKIVSECIEIELK